MVVLGLAGVAHDEVGAEGRFGRLRPDLLDAPEEAGAVAPPTHPPHQRGRHVLEREVEVGHARGQDGAHQAVGEVRRVQVQQAHPRHPARHRLDQGYEVLGAHPLIAPVAGQVLGHQHDLLCAAGHQLVHLGEDLLDGAGALRAAEARDGAEAARLVAALGHLHIGPGHRRRRPGQVEQIEARQRRGVGLAAQGDRHAEAAHRVGLRQGGGQLVAVALGHAPGDDQLGAVGLAVGQRQDHVDGLLAGLLDEGAGVDHHEVGVLRRGRRGHPVGQHGAHQLVGVDLVLGAAEGLDEEGAAPRHGAKGTGGLLQTPNPRRCAAARRSSPDDDTRMGEARRPEEGRPQTEWWRRRPGRGHSKLTRAPVPDRVA